MFKSVSVPLLSLSYYSCPNPTVSSTAIVSFCCRSKYVSYAGRSKRLKLTRTRQPENHQRRRKDYDVDNDIPGMGLRQSILRPRILDREPPWAIASLQILEPIDWYSGSARCELQEPRLLFRVPGLNALQEPVSVGQRKHSSGAEHACQKFCMTGDDSS